MLRTLYLEIRLDLLGFLYRLSDRQTRRYQRLLQATYRELVKAYKAEATRTVQEGK